MNNQTPTPIYSLCICNFNMAETLERSLSSVMDQLDNDFETLVVDDGSSDDSLVVLSRMQENYPNLRVIPMPRDRKRRLGLTRNESIRQARGKYVLLHIDCDDIYGPHLIDFTKAFHMIESATTNDFLLSGQHVNMARRDFLLNYGPYRDLYRGEDRDMWLRLAAVDAYLPLKHVNFVTRLPKTRKKRFWRSIVNTYDHILNDFRTYPGFPGFYKYELEKWPSMNTPQILFRILCLFPAFLASLREEKLLPPKGMEKPEFFVAYRNERQGSLSEILARYSKEPDWNALTPEGQNIFT